MTFIAPLALLIAVFVAGPLLAHLLRRRRPIERVFPPTRLVPSARPVARRRAYIEDRALFAVRALAILALSLVAASPLVRCSRLSIDRRGGSSVALALVIDDSMSMSADLPLHARRGGATSRFELAMVAARELTSSLRSGDQTTIVLASAPARVALAPTGEAAAVREMLDRLARDGASDGATDLDSAIALATATLHDLPQPDRRIVLLSDLADGSTDGSTRDVEATSGASSAGKTANGPQPRTPLSLPEGEHMTLEAPLEVLRSPPPRGAADCAIVSATKDGGTNGIRARVACALQGTSVGKRAIEIVTADARKIQVGIAAFPANPPASPSTFDVVVAVDGSKVPNLESNAGRPSLFARIDGEVDAIAADDVAPVLGAATAKSIGVVVSETLNEGVETGGPSVLERALLALESGMSVRPIPSVPDRESDLAPFSALAIDDPSGFGPEARAAIASWMNNGGVVLLAVGARASAAPLGATFEPILKRPLRWEKVTAPLGIDPSRAGLLGEGESARDLGAHARTLLDREDIERSTVSASWKDGVPLVLTRAIGQGEAWIVTLPFSPSVSDFALRPSFLTLLDAFLTRARDTGAGVRLEVGKAWSVVAAATLDVVALDEEGRPRSGASGSFAIPLEQTADVQRARPRRIGAYLVTTTPIKGDVRRDLRAVAPSPREVDLTPRALSKTVTTDGAGGMQRSTKELAPTLTLILTLLAAIELAVRALRVFIGARNDDAAAQEA
ncbi:MAG: hypothetical protein NVS3B20_14840 [Polyangiales bacterium]